MGVGRDMAGAGADEEGPACASVATFPWPSNSR